MIRCRSAVAKFSDLVLEEHFFFYTDKSYTFSIITRFEIFEVKLSNHARYNVREL